MPQWWHQWWHRCQEGLKRFSEARKRGECLFCELRRHQPWRRTYCCIIKANFTFLQVGGPFVPLEAWKQKLDRNLGAAHTGFLWLFIMSRLSAYCVLGTALDNKSWAWMKSTPWRWPSFVISWHRKGWKSVNEQTSWMGGRAGVGRRAGVGGVWSRMMNTSGLSCPLVKRTFRLPIK